MAQGEAAAREAAPIQPDPQPLPRRRRRRPPQAIAVILLIIALCQLEVIGTALRLSRTPGLEHWLVVGLGSVFPAVAVIFSLGPFIHVPTMLTGRRLPGWVMSGVVGPSYVFILACIAHAVLGGLVALVRLAAGIQPTATASALGLAAPFLLAAYGASSGQLWLRVERIEVVLKGLGAGLSGLRVVQLSDLHTGGLVGERRLRRIAARVAELTPDMVVVTGDIVNASPAEARLAAAILGQIDAPLGVWACLGNHDHFVDGDAVAEILEQAGVRVLRNQGEVIRRGDGAFWLAGVDDTWTQRNDLPAALAQRPAGMPTLLLAHDPNLWPQAVEHKVEMTLSGHTHGGQIGLVKLHPSISLARMITPFVAGLYRREGSQLYVSRGTANSLPLRLGAPPEVSVHLLLDQDLVEALAPA